MRRAMTMVLVVGLVGGVLGARLSAAPAAAEKPAVDAARAWLGLVDAAKYGESWDAAAAVFRGAVAKEAWSATAGGVRAPLGKVVSRTLKAAKPATSLPGAPDGHYVVIQFDTVFEHKAAAVETVTPMLEKDGAWRVSGYFIR